MNKIIDGNIACANIAYLFSEMSFIYPITPSSPMASQIDKLSHTERKNLFNDKPNVVLMQSEAGAAGSLHGSLLAGSLASTYTSSQGLLLMIPNMYKMAGELLPGVIHVASRTVATHALSIFGDHSDIYATRQTGFCMLASSSVEDASNLAIVAHLSAIKGSLPFLHFFDGFRTSHEINKINQLEDEEILKLVDYDSINVFRKRMLTVGKGIQKGMAENEDIYFQSVEARNKFYERIPHIVNDYMEQINKLTNSDYKPFKYYGDPQAENIIVAMGSVCDTIRLVVDKENKAGKKLGMIEVHLYRPFSIEYLLKVLPTTVKNIAVLDRTKEAGSIGEPLYLDILTALKDKNINIVGGRYGLSSKNTEPKDIKSVYDMLDTNLQNNFTIGILDDITNLSLTSKEYNIDLNAREIKIWGFGSDGMVSASKDILKIVGDKSYVQGYFEYDSKKSGGVTISNLRIKDEKIKAPYYVTNPDLIVVTKDTYLKNYNVLENIKDNGIFVLNTSDYKKVLDNKTKKIIKDKNIIFYVIDANDIALKANIKGKISKIMETIILKLINFENFETIIKENIKSSFKTKGEDIVTANILAVDNSLESLKLIEEDLIFEEEILKEESIIDKIRNRKGNELKVSEIIAHCDGTFRNANTKEEKRKIAESVAKWIPENCIECGQCSLVCPHAAIRSFITEDKGIPLIGNDNLKYYISVSEADCTNCMLCQKICPGKNGLKAIEFGSYDETKQQEANDLFENHINPQVTNINKFTIKGSQLQKPCFEFSGACAGCGETPYIKLLTQLFGKKLIVANATGCSSIYGGSAPSTPYSIPWANSLFEDNAEFGLGMNLSYKKIRERIEKIMNESLSVVDNEVKELFTLWLENKNNYDITSKIKQDLKTKEIPLEIKDLIDYIPAFSVWSIGGDGWAYDIGFSGIDQALSSNENVNILVLDTEVYSNTGGQFSKASRIGQIAEFADLGKKTVKKDLFKIAMGYPNCYVASISLGANPMHTIKAFKEAEAHDGPSIIIAYSPCVSHGIKNGMSCALETEKEIINVGYSLLMRYNPKEDKFYLDSKEPDFTKYKDHLLNEVRYKALKIKNESLAEELFEEQKQEAIKRYEYYKNLSIKE